MEGKFHTKPFAIIICALLLVFLGVSLKIFVIGEPVDGAQVYYTASVSDRSLELRIASIESGVALRDWKYKQDGGTLFVSARKVLVSPLFDKGDYETVIDIAAVDNISFGGRKIWPN